MDYEYTIDYTRHTSQTVPTENSNAHSDYSNGYSMGFVDGYTQKDKEIVRCKDCKYFESWDYTYYKTTECTNQHVRDMTNGDDMTIFCPEEDFYCLYGERKETNG